MLEQVIVWSNTNQGFSLVLLTTLYVLCTILIVSSSFTSNRLAQKHLSSLWALEKRRIKPTIVLQIYNDVPFYHVKVINVGGTTAYDIKFEITPMFRRLIKGGKSGKVKVFGSLPAEHEISFLVRGIASLVPAASFQSLIGIMDVIREDNPSLRYEGFVSYRDGDGTPYQDSLVIDLNDYRDISYTRHKTIHDVAEKLEGIERELGHIGSGFHKLHVLTQDFDDYKKEQEQFIATIREKGKSEGVPEAGSFPTKGD